MLRFKNSKSVSQNLPVFSIRSKKAVPLLFRSVLLHDSLHDAVQTDTEQPASNLQRLKKTSRSKRGKQRINRI